MKELTGQCPRPRIFGLEPPLVVCCQSHLRRHSSVEDHGQELYPFELANVAYCYSVNPNTTPWSNKKQDTKLLSITSPNNDRFSKFFYCYTQQEICIEDVITDPPHLNGVATLPCEILMYDNIACPICWGIVF